MSEENSNLPSNSLGDQLTLILPPLVRKEDGKTIVPLKRLSMSLTKEARQRQEETRTVGPANYIDLEIMYSKAFGELRRNYADVGLALIKAEAELDNVDARITLEDYPEHIKDKPRSYDKPATLKAFKNKDPEYVRLRDYIGTLKAFERLLEGEMKNITQIVSYMKKQVDIKRGDRFNIPGR